MKRILLFNLQPSGSGFLKKKLEDMGHLVTDITEEKKRFHLPCSSLFDIIVANYLTPDTTIFQTIPKLRYQYPNADVLAIDKEQPINGGKDSYQIIISTGYFQKLRAVGFPVDLNRLLGVINQIETNQPIFLRRRHRHKHFQILVNRKIHKYGDLSC